MPGKLLLPVFVLHIVLIFTDSLDVRRMEPWSISQSEHIKSVEKFTQHNGLKELMKKLTEISGGVEVHLE